MLDQSDNLRPHQTERVITAGRFLVAIFLVVAIEAGPVGPERYAQLLKPLSLAYLAYAGVIGLLTWTRRNTPRHLPLITHLVDLALFSIVMHLTEGPTSPFFVYFIFATVCGALRWHGRGALFTGAAALTAYVFVVFAGSAVLPGEEFDRVRFITRCTQLAVITLLLAYIGMHQRRLQTEIAGLAAWPRRLPAEESAAVRDVLTHAAAVLRVPRLILTWQQEEEPSLRIAVQDGERFDLTRERPDVFGTLVDERLLRSSFFCDDASAPTFFVVYRIPGGVDSMRNQPLDPTFCERYQVKSVLAVRIAAEAIEGRLFALDRAALSIDDLLLGDIVGRLVAGALEQQALLTQLRDSAAGEERLRLARELHDGVLQALTAVGLQAARLRALLQDPGAEAESRLAFLQDTIVAEQRRLRELLDELRPERTSVRTNVDPRARLSEVVTRVSRQWEVEVRSGFARDLPELSDHLVHEICRMCEEALVNAIRHGGAREVDIALERAPGGTVRLTIGYMGRGFTTFSGRHDLSSLTRMRAGPRTLKERVSALGGNLEIESSDSGARLEIVVSAGAQARDRA